MVVDKVKKETMITDVPISGDTRVPGGTRVSRKERSL